LGFELFEVEAALGLGCNKSISISGANFPSSLGQLDRARTSMLEYN
jgi:hypothetical protein